MQDNNNESFRDSISTITEEGKRSWVFPKKPSGPLYNKRKWVSYGLLLFLFAAPFIKINGNQFLLFNVLERRFNIFGFPFWPQDFYLFVISMIVGVVGLTLFTVAFGRIFCGWICPQTIFMEMVFRRIEYWIDGDRGAQIRLDKQAWDAEKIRKRLTKWGVFFVVSFIIANVFTAYLVGSDKLFAMVKDGPMAHIQNFSAILIFTAVFYFIFAWFREQVCIIACPYGRLQGVLLDNQSVVVAYDYVRGEKELGRAKFDKREDRTQSGKGDCIDCNQCVVVCPTGIDIRNGTQLECVNCTACIDECDTIMDKVGLPKGLIRYASESEISEKKPFKLTLRMKGYAAVLTILTGVLIGMLFLRSDLQTTILRLPGNLYQNYEDKVRNVFTYKIVNKTNNEYEEVYFKLVDPINGQINLVGNDRIQVPKNELAKGTLFIDIHPKELTDDKTKIQIEIYNGEIKIQTISTNFMSPREF